MTVCMACGHEVCPAPDCIRFGVTAEAAARCSAWPEMCSRPDCERCRALGDAVRVRARVTAASTLRDVPLDENTARELSRAAKQAVTWTERRNHLIREAAAKGAGPRELGRAVGLSHAAVINIIKPRQR